MWTCIDHMKPWIVWLVLDSYCFYGPYRYITQKIVYWINYEHVLIFLSHGNLSRIAYYFEYFLLYVTIKFNNLYFSILVYQLWIWIGHTKLWLMWLMLEDYTYQGVIKNYNMSRKFVFKVLKPIYSLNVPLCTIA